MEDYIWVLLTAMVAAAITGGFIDGSTWWIRSYSDSGEMGSYIARTNIYNYFGRTFSFIYLSCLSLLVDTGQSTQTVALAIGLSGIIGATIQPLLLNHSAISQAGLATIARFLKLRPRPLPRSHERLEQGPRLFLYTASANFFLAMAGSIPYVVASIFPQFRLTISTTTQILNSFGTILVLAFVDQILFALWDKSNLAASLPYYMGGRVVGGTVAGALLIALFIFVEIHGV